MLTALPAFRKRLFCSLKRVTSDAAHDMRTELIVTRFHSSISRRDTAITSYNRRKLTPLINYCKPEATIVELSKIVIRRMICAIVCWIPRQTGSTKRFTGWLSTISQAHPSRCWTDPSPNWKMQIRGKCGRAVCCTTTSDLRCTTAACSCTALLSTSESVCESQVTQIVY